VGSVGSGAGEWMDGQLHSTVRAQAVLSHWPTEKEVDETVPFWGDKGRGRLKLEWECMGKKGFVCALWNCFVHEVLMEMLR
jgi:hypothetical protein